MNLSKQRGERVRLFFVVLFFSLGFFTYCANPMAPQGGPIDSTAPKILSVTPPLFSTNFSAQRVTITFDEYVQLKNSSSEIIISPALESRPTFTVKGRSVVIDFKQKFDSMTTYKIDFGQAIQDNNEGNPLTNFSYVFSTGSDIDSLAMTGQVIDAFTGDSILNAVIFLYDAKKDSLEADSVLYNSLPNSITRTDSMGVFIATNLKGIDYKVYAFKEETANSQYDKGADKVAFLDSLLNPTKMPDFKVWYNPLRMKVEADPQVQFRLFSEPMPDRRQNLQKTSRPTKNEIFLEFADKNPIINSIKLDSMELEDVVVKYSRYSDSVWIYYPYIENMPDTLKGAVEYMTTTSDSLAKDTMVIKEFKHTFFEAKKSKLKEGEKEINPFKMTTESSSQLSPYNSMIFSFGMPIKSIDSLRVELRKSIVQEEKAERGARGVRSGASNSTSESSEVEESSEPQFESVPFTFTQDTLDLLKWNLNSKWEDGASYTLFIPDSVFVDILNQKNDTLESEFKILEQTKHGLVKIELTGRDSSTNYIVMLEKKNEIAYQQKFVDGDNVVFDYVNPDFYKIKVVEDRNKNGKWDDGILTERVMPERVAVFRHENGNSQFEVKENWEIEGIVLDIKSLFP